MPRSQHRRADRLSGGFTLVELMIVVAIIAVLAVVAVTAYSRHIKSARVLDARTFLAAIQARQETYFQQHGVYCDVSGTAISGPSGFYPPLAPGEPQPKSWNAAVPARWLNFGARPEAQQVFASFYVRASLPTVNPNSNHARDAFVKGKDDTTSPDVNPGLGIARQPREVDASSTVSPHPWYYAIAHLDLSAPHPAYTDGHCPGDLIDNASCTTLWTSSGRGVIVVGHEGQ